jgi:hypothetical protein
MATPRESYDNCQLILRQLGQPARIDSVKLKQALEDSGALAPGRKPELLESYDITSSIYRESMAQQAQAATTELLKQTARLGTITHREGNKLSSFMAAYFDWTFGAAHKVKAPIDQVRNMAASALEMVARAKASAQSDLLTTYVKSLGLDTVDAQEVAVGAVEIGSLSRSKFRSSPTAVILEDVESKVQAYTDYLVDLGLSQQQIDELFNLGYNVTHAMDEVNITAAAFGVNIDSLTGLGWLHRVYTKPMQLILNELRTKQLFGNIVDPASITLKSLVNRARETNLFLVEDAVAMATVLGLTPANHVFVPQVHKTFQIPMKVIASTVYNAYSTSALGAKAFIRANSASKVLNSRFSTWADLKKDIFAKAIKDFNSMVMAGSKHTAHLLLPVLGVDAVLTADGVVVGTLTPDLARMGYSRGFNRYTMQSAEEPLLLAMGLEKPADWRKWAKKKYKPVMSQQLIDSYTPNDFIVLQPNSRGKSTIIETAKFTNRAGAAINWVETYRWGMGRASDLSSFSYVKDTYSSNVPKLSTSDPYKAMGNYAKAGVSGSGSKATKDAIDEAVRLKDEPALLNYATTYRQPDDYGLIVQDKQTGQYALFDFGAVPDLIEHGGLNGLEAIFDPKYAYGLLDLIRNSLGSADSRIVETLVDSGILSKVPMSSYEFTEYFTQKFKLPFTRPSQVINMNFDELWLDTANKLKSAVSTSAVLTKLVRGDGERAGWLIGGDRFRQDVVQYKGYIQLGSNSSIVELLKNIGLGDVASEITDMYIHPVVYRQLEATIRMSTSPAELAQIGSFWHGFRSTWSKSMFIMNPTRYVVNNTLDPLINSKANGGDLLHLPKRTKDVHLFLRNGNLDHIDNTTLLYIHPSTGESLTARQATELFLQNRIQGFASGSVDIPLGSAKGAAGTFVGGIVDLATFAKHMAQWATWDSPNRSPAENLARAGRVLTSIGEETVTKVFSGQGFAATIADKTIQLNHFLGLLKPIHNADGIAARRRLTSAGFFDGYAESIEDLWERMDLTFPNPYNAGRATKAMHTFGMPLFAAYIVKTPFLALKMVMRRPVQFYNIMRAGSIMSGAYEKHNELADMEFTEYQTDSFVLGEYVDSAGEVNRFMLYPTFNNTFNTFDAIDKAVQYVDGTYTIHTIDDLAKMEDSAAARMAREITLMSQPLVKDAYRLITGKNPLTGQDYSEMYGDKNPSLLLWNLPPLVRDSILDWFPPFRFLDSWNPGNMFGVAPIKDSQGNTIVDGRLGLNNVERYPARAIDRLRLAPEATNWLYRALTISGMTVTIANADVNVQNNLKKLDAVHVTLQTRYQQMQIELDRELNLGRSQLSPEELKRREQIMMDTLSLYMLVDLERVKWAYYQAYAKGKLTPAVINKANSEIDTLIKQTGNHTLLRQYEQVMQIHAEEMLRMRRALYGEEAQ